MVLHQVLKYCANISLSLLMLVNEKFIVSQFVGFFSRKTFHCSRPFAIYPINRSAGYSENHSKRFSSKYLQLVIDFLRLCN